MRKFMMSVLVGAALFAPLCVSAADAPQGSTAAAAPGSEAARTKEALAKYREAMQATRADIMAKGLTLSADQAAKFWPMFEQYQKEQNVVIDAQIEAIQRYADHFSTLTDSDAINFVKALLERDDKMQALRVKWLAKFQTAVSAGTAARAIQLDRKLSQIAQAQLSSEIPLVH
jgi:Spy/CpxP family protein refolding chaperone